MATDASAARAQDTLFVRQCSLQGLADRLPLPWPTPPGTPPSPKRTYRSHYIYRSDQDLHDPAAWAYLSDFDLVLRLVDFTGLRPVLAQRLGWTTARGWTPFDPVSLFLLHAWQIANSWSRTQTLAHLADPRYADYAQRFGFQNDVFPTEGGLRYYLTTLGAHAHTPAAAVTVTLDDNRTVAVPIPHLNDLIAQSVTLLHDAGVISQDAWHKALVCPDGMLHDAASRRRCAFVQDSCYQPVNPQTHTRPCPAKAADTPHRGCACDTPACAEICRHGTPRDPAARLVVYSGSNHDPHDPNQPLTDNANQKKDGRRCYGYRSVRLQLADTERHTGVVLLSTVLPASDREENPAAALLRQTPTVYPTLHLDATAGDAAFGYAAYLRTAYDLNVKRIVDLRADASDKIKDGWVIRGYDDKGRPLCAYGYALASHGFDPLRRRHKWICAQACLRTTEPRITVAGTIYPPPQCPYHDHHPWGHILNIGARFADGSLRLVRDLPVATPAWERTYHRARNAVEAHHARFETWGFKRLSVYGVQRAQTMLFHADVWVNLITMARLVREATNVAGGP